MKHIQLPYRLIDENATGVYIPLVPYAASMEQRRTSRPIERDNEPYKGPKPRDDNETLRRIWEDARQDKGTKRTQKTGE